MLDINVFRSSGAGIQSKHVVTGHFTDPTTGLRRFGGRPQGQSISLMKKQKNLKLYQIQIVNIIGSLVGVPACNVLSTCSCYMPSIGKTKTVTLIAVFTPVVNLGTEVLQLGIKLPSVCCSSNSNQSIDHHLSD